MTHELPQDFSKQKERESPYDLPRLTDLAHAIVGGQWLPRIRVDPKGDKAYFTHDPGPPTVVLGGAFAEERQLEESERLFVNGHEFIHYLQFASDRETYKRVFRITKEKGQGDPLREKAWERFFNVFLDIHDNAQLIKRSVVFREGQRLEQIPRDLYGDKLFPGTDYTSNPHCIQLMDYCLRRMMVPGEDIEVVDEVRQVLDEPVLFFGQPYRDLESFVRERFFSERTSLKEWMFSLKNVLMPKFEELLKNDLAHGRLTAENLELDDNFPGFNPTDPDNFKDIDKYLEDKEKSAADRAKERAKEKFTERMKDQDYSQEQIEEMWDRKERCAPVVEKMKSFWWYLIGSSMKYDMARRSRFKTGSSVSPQALQSQMAVFLTDPSKAEIMERSVVIPTGVEIRPKQINLRLMIDASGSMFSNESRIQAAKDAQYALAQSLILFAREGQINNEDNFPVEVNLQLIAYGTDARNQLVAGKGGEEQVLKELSLLNVSKDPLASFDLLQKALMGLSDLGGTCNSDAFIMVEDSIDRQIARGELAEQDMVDIVLEITDGGTQTLDEAKEIRKRIKEKERVSKGIQIAESLQDNERQTFIDLYGEDGHQLKSLDELLPTCLKLLAEVLIAREE
jgi:hypothetical protein